MEGTSAQQRGSLILGAEKTSELYMAEMKQGPYLSEGRGAAWRWPCRWLKAEGGQWTKKEAEKNDLDSWAPWLPARGT